MVGKGSATGKGTERAKGESSVESKKDEGRIDLKTVQKKLILESGKKNYRS